MTTVSKFYQLEVEIKRLKEELHFTDLRWLVAENKLDQIRELAPVIDNVDLNMLLENQNGG